MSDLVSELFKAAEFYAKRPTVEGVQRGPSLTEMSRGEANDLALLLAYAAAEIRTLNLKLIQK